MTAGTAKQPRVDMARVNETRGPYTYVGLRHADIQKLRDFRNAQIAVLRQKAPLSERDQEDWFETVVEPMHASATPSFLLVSILEGDSLFIGYGGLTNIDWHHRRAEVSFLVDPDRASDARLYREDFSAFLNFLKTWAFGELALRRLFTETFAFRDYHMSILEAAGFRQEGRMRDHIVDPNDETKFVDSVLHGITSVDAGVT